MVAVVDMSLSAMSKEQRRQVARIMRANGTEQKGDRQCAQCAEVGTLCWKLSNKSHCDKCYVDGVVCRSIDASQNKTISIEKKVDSPVLKRKFQGDYPNASKVQKIVSENIKREIGDFNTTNTVSRHKQPVAKGPLANRSQVVSKDTCETSAPAELNVKVESQEKQLQLHSGIELEAVPSMVQGETVLGHPQDSGDAKSVNNDGPEAHNSEVRATPLHETKVRPDVNHIRTSTLSVPEESPSKLARIRSKYKSSKALCKKLKRKLLFRVKERSSVPPEATAEQLSEINKLKARIATLNEKVIVSEIAQSMYKAMAMRDTCAKIKTES